MMCILSCVSAQHGCKEWLFEFMWPSWQLKPVWPFTSNSFSKKTFLPENCNSLDVFSFSFKSLLCIKISEHQQFLKNPNLPVFFPAVFFFHYQPYHMLTYCRITQYTVFLFHMSSSTLFLNYYLNYCTISSSVLLTLM